MNYDKIDLSIKAAIDSRKRLISMKFGEKVCCLKHLTILTLS